MLPSDAAWFSSPEPKARATAAALTELPITIVSDLREMARPAAWYEQDEFVAMATRAFANPDEPASAEWETARSTTHRVSQAVQAIVAANLTNVVLVGHGTAWTLLVSILTATPPDVVAWHRMLFPDHLSIAGARVDSGWGAWTT